MIDLLDLLLNNTYFHLVAVIALGVALVYAEIRFRQVKRLVLTEVGGLVRENLRLQIDNGKLYLRERELEKAIEEAVFELNYDHSSRKADEILKKTLEGKEVE